MRLLIVHSKFTGIIPMSTNQLTVEVVYCGKSQQVLKKLLVNHGTTVQDVIKISEIQKHFMEVDSPK
jgi:putative ubiquitin-RnfH superfamily antitoxin RatB of RatAB toxin-antitoxin module